MEFGRIYFFTATIHKWIPLLEEDSFKEIIISSLNFLHKQDLMRIYGFVILPSYPYQFVLDFQSEGAAITQVQAFQAWPYLTNPIIFPWVSPTANHGLTALQSNYFSNDF
jgi:hypothetical protein